MGKHETDYLEKGDSLVEQYENYSQKTMVGAHGKATKFWVIYIYYVNTYLVLHRCKNSRTEFYRK